MFPILRRPLTERTASEARHIAATIAVTDAIRSDLHVMRDDHHAVTSLVLDAQQVAAQEVRARIEVLVDALSSVRDQQAHRVVAEIAACTQMVRTACSELQAHFDGRLEHLRRDQEVRMARLQSLQVRERDRLLRDLMLVSSRCSRVGSASHRRLNG